MWLTNAVDEGQQPVYRPLSVRKGSCHREDIQRCVRAQ